MTRHQLEMLIDIHNRHDGVVPSGEWTTGTGKRTARRTPPPHCELLDMLEAVRLPGAVGRAARRLRNARPRVQRVVAITNLRAARRAIRSAPPKRVAVKWEPYRDIRERLTVAVQSRWKINPRYSLTYYWDKRTRSQVAVATVTIGDQSWEGRGLGKRTAKQAAAQAAWDALVG